MIDRVYGETRIDDPLAQDIVATAAFQRLRGVDQAGYEQAFLPEYVHSRYEHSVGAYLLLDRYGADREEKIAGLIHDLSHTAFSHCTEYAIEHAGDITKMELQDNLHVDFVKSTEVAEVLEAHEVDVDFVLDEHNFPLLEQPLPSICADRIDYSLRGGVLTAALSQSGLSVLFSELEAIDDQWVYKSPAAARLHAEVFKFLNDNYWSGIETGVMFYSVGEFLKRAFELGLVSFDEMHATDAEILAKTVPFIRHDAELRKHWRRMNNEVPYHNDPDDYEVALPCKSRAIDPLCVEDDELKQLSQTDGNEDWTGTVESDSIPRTYYLRFDD